MSDLARSLIDAATQAIERVDEGLLPEPAEFFSNSAYGAQAVAAVVAVLETLADHTASPPPDGPARWAFVNHDEFRRLAVEVKSEGR